MNFYQEWGQGCQLFFRRFRLKTIKDILDFILLIWYIKYINRKGMVYYMEALDIDISGMAGALIEHSMVISNFLIKAGSQEIDEYWIVDWQKKQIEIYTLDYDEHKEPQYYLFNTITENNKEDLKMVHFPNIKITFNELFDGIDYNI